MSELLLFLVVFPLVGVLLVFGLKNRLGGYGALLVAIVQMLATFFLWKDLSHNSIIEFSASWLNFIRSNFHFAIDGLSMLMLFLVNLLMPLIILSSFNEKESYPNSFFALILLMQFGLMGVFTAKDGLLFYIFWELTLIPVWFISGLWGQEDKRLAVTKKFFIYTFLGSLLMLGGLVYVYQFSGSFAMQDLYQVKLNETEQILIFWLIFMAFAVKLPLFPFHTWLPDTHTYAPTQGSMLLSGIMLKMAVYGVIRFLPIAPEALLGFSGKMVLVFVIIGANGGLIALVLKNVKTIIAYSSISHLCMMAGGIFASSILTLQGHFNTEGGEGAMLQTMAHAINATGLFYAADILYKRFKTKDITKMGGMAKVAPKFAVLFMIIVLGAMAVPLTNGFVGEFILLKTLYEYDFRIGILAGMSIILTAGYLLRMYSKAMFGQGNEEILAQIKDVNGVEFFVMIVLAALVLVFGVFPNVVLDLVREPLRLIYESF